MLNDLALQFVDQGHQVDVLTSLGTYAGGSAIPGGTRAARVHSVWTGRTGSRLAEWLLFFVQVCVRVPLSSWDRCVILTDPPFLVVTAILARLLGRRGVYWWTMDLYPEALVAQGMITRTGVLHRALSMLNEMALTSLEGVICLGERQRQHLEGYARWPKKNKEFDLVVPPWDQRPMLPVEPARNRFLLKFGWHDKILVLYAGNLGEAHIYQEILEAAQVLSARDDWRWQFVFVVRGVNRKLLERKCTGLNNVAVLDYQPEDLTSDMLWAAHIHLVTMREGWQGIVVPSKLYGTLQTGAPTLFIGPRDADTSTVVRALGLGETIVPGTTGEDVVEALERLAARERRYAVTVPSDGPKRIVEFVCRGPNQQQPQALTPDAAKTGSSSMSTAQQAPRW
jgi:colanic acid biosynthesis glycosyl transferase WcaI